MMNGGPDLVNGSTAARAKSRQIRGAPYTADSAAGWRKGDKAWNFH